MLYQNTEIIESCRQNNGARTVLSCVLDAYATVAPHVHTLFSESVFVEYGSIDLWNGFGKVHLELGQSMSIEAHTLHHYIAGKTGVRLTVTLEPGNLNFEYAVQIMQGVRRDSIDSALHTNQDPVFMAVIGELTNFNPPEGTTGPNTAFINSPEVKALKQALLTKYCV